MAEDTPELEAAADQLPLASSSSVILRAREPFLAWIRSLGVADDALRTAERDPEVFLVPEADRDEEVQEWVDQHWPVLFASMVTHWSRDEDRWPGDMTLEQFRDWFQVDVAAAVTDLSGLAPDEDTYSGSPVELGAAVAAFERLDDDGLLFVDERSGQVHGLPGDVVDLFEEFDAQEAGDEDDDGTDEDAERPRDEDAEAAADVEEDVEVPFAAVLEAYGAGALVCVATREEFDLPQVMTDFVATVRIAGVRQRLLDTLHGRRQEQRFLQSVDRAGLRHAWTRFQREAITAFLEDALTMRGVPLRN